MSSQENNKEQHFRENLRAWLKRNGFTEDPFAVNKAEQEQANLTYIFVDRPYLYEIIGDPLSPQVAFLLAKQGGGKTATREMVAYECEEAKLEGRVLVVRYYDFSPLLQMVDGDISRLTSHHHVRVVIRHALKALVAEVPEDRFKSVKGMDGELLRGYAAEFADPVTALRVARLLPDFEPTRLEWGALSSLETLHNFTELVTHLGKLPGTDYEAIYVLVDRVDETAAGYEAALPLLKPLVSEGTLLEMEHLAFKFFLPVEVGEQLRHTVSLRPDRWCIQTVTWRQEDLQKMIKQRLDVYSRGNVLSLEQLFETKAKADEPLREFYELCEDSPRTLLRLCGELIRNHVERSKSGPIALIIALEDLKITIDNFKHRLEAEGETPLFHDDRAGPPPEKGLYLDRSDQVWVDGEVISAPLSGLELELLKTLYRRAPEIVPVGSLLEALWAEEHKRDEQNLRKLVARLRGRLSPDKSRFVKNLRGRGYWLKTC